MTIVLPQLDTLAGQDVDVLRDRLRSILRAMRWDELLGKQRGGEQTLLDHCLAVFDVLCACAPFFAAEARPALTPGELLGILLAAVAHDAGKADKSFQAYLRGESTSFAEHVDAACIREVVTRVAGKLEIEDRYVEDIVSQAVLHDRRMRLDEGEITEWARPHESGRWRKLADFVNHADSLASCEDVVAAESFLRGTPLLLGRARVSCYQLHVRGVSTTFLHEAALGAFEQAGYRPILHFAEGTVLAGFGDPPDRAAVEAAIRRRVEKIFADRKEELPELTVGQALRDFLPGYKYVRRETVREVLRVASRRAGRKVTPTTDKQAEQRAQLIAKYREQWAKEEGLGGQPTEAEIQAILDVGPEACAFKIAKEVFRKVLDEEADHAVGRKLFDTEFGAGGFDRFMRQSTFMPVRDYALCVRGWHRMRHEMHVVGDLDPAKRTDLLVGDLDPAKRTDLLIEKLGRVLQGVLATREAPLPSERLVDEWTRQLLLDLAVEATAPPRDEVVRQLAGYVAFKSRSRSKAKPPQQCAQCAALIQPGEGREGCAALGNVGSFSNRRLAFEGQGQPPICPRCVVDLELGQLCLGRPVMTIIGAVPRRSLGTQGARELVRKVRELRSTLDRQLSPETADPGSYVALSLPQVVLRRDSLRASIVLPVTAETRKKRSKDLAKALTERLGEDGLDELNCDHSTSFDSMESLARVLLDGAAPPAVREDPDVRAAVAGVVGGGRADFAAITPNLVVVSLDRELAAEESQADRALYAFGLAALFACELETACLVAPVSEVRTALESRAGRTVYVPANGPARRLLGGDWLGIHDAARWLRALRAAIVLRDRAGARSVLEVLRYPSAGFAIRRIEQQPDGQPVGVKLWPFVEALKEVLG